MSGASMLVIGLAKDLKYYLINFKEDVMGQEKFLKILMLVLVAVLIYFVIQIRNINQETVITVSIPSPGDVQLEMQIIDVFTEAEDENGMTKTQRDNLDKFLNGSD
jgi:hypothetical protein